MSMAVALGLSALASFLRLRPVNVLVFPCGSEIGLEIHAALRHAKDICLHGASSVSDHGEFVYARYRQIAAQAGGTLTEVNPLIVQGVAQAMRVQTSGMGGAFAWPSLLRKADRLDPSFRT